MSLPERSKQRRWTVLLRFFLGLPLAIVLYFIGIATGVLVFIGWFGALFTGRTPSFTRSLVTIYLRMSLRLTSYLSLLTDKFPPFEFEEVAEYPTSIGVPFATTMNRWAVFFRYFLFIPAAILSGIVSFGLGVLSFFMWFVVLITGWLPASMHDAFRAVIRYQVRSSAYVYLLVPTYPGGLFGDPTSPPEAAIAGTVVDAGTMPRQPRWNLNLNRAAKRVLVFAIVLGAIAYPGAIVGEVVFINHVAIAPTQKVVDAYNTLIGQYNRFAFDTQQGCQSEEAVTACVEGADRGIAPKLTAFADTVQGSSVFGLDQFDLDQAASDARQLAAAYTTLSQAGPTEADYLTVAASTGVNQKVNTLRSALATVRSDINGN